MRLFSGIFLLVALVAVSSATKTEVERGNVRYWGPLRTKRTIRYSNTNTSIYRVPRFTGSRYTVFNGLPFMLTCYRGTRTPCVASPVFVHNLLSKILCESCLCSHIGTKNKLEKMYIIIFPQVPEKIREEWIGGGV